MPCNVQGDDPRGVDQNAGIAQSILLAAHNQSAAVARRNKDQRTDIAGDIINLANQGQIKRAIAACVVIDPKDRDVIIIAAHKDIGLATDFRKGGRRAVVQTRLRTNSLDQITRQRIALRVKLTRAVLVIAACILKRQLARTAEGPQRNAVLQTFVACRQDKGLTRTVGKCLDKASNLTCFARKIVFACAAAVNLAVNMRQCARGLVDRIADQAVRRAARNRNQKRIAAHRCGGNIKNIV